MLTCKIIFFSCTYFPDLARTISLVTGMTGDESEDLTREHNRAKSLIHVKDQSQSV